ncbi:agrin-like isoform X1 [Nasonia vitripennis]|uniref:Kazal-like domain-containing protein n=1 Tax=Nasonia vitripennis TaxID=7425 RepID=A0A7M7QMC3_NASVI|nr:agrin-like isoform X1 [Nasonia vitripennis]
MITYFLSCIILIGNLTTMIFFHTFLNIKIPIFISHQLIIFFCTALTPSALLQEQIDLKYELWNSDSFKDCRCNYTLDLVPICENKDVTYNRKEMSACINKCSKNSTLNIIHNRECSEKSTDQLSSKPTKECKDCKLTNEFAPVCGNDGVTYPNPSYLFCVAECEKPGLLYSHCGFCLPQDKEKYEDNEVMMNDVSKKVSKNLLDSLTTCDCVIKYNLNPICGSDDVTYPNPSMLYCIKKCRKTDLQIKSCGKCLTKDPQELTDSEKASKFTDTVNQCLASCPVPLELNQVCGTDDKTYDSISILKCYNSCTNETISVQYYGTCDDKCKCIADKDYNPVCGSDGNTYANPSTLFCAEKCLKSNLKLSYCGKCDKQKELVSERKEAVISDTLSKVFHTCGCIFTKEYAPLCASDGTVYGNPSIFYCARQCMKSDITIKNCGYCNKSNEESSVKAVQQTTSKNFKSLSRPLLKCDCVATSTLYPVCGTDGVTYPHPSYIYCTKNCKANDASTEDLQLAYCGTCKEGDLEIPKPDKAQDELLSESLNMFEKCQCKITREWNPVCGTNNVTYGNPSIFYCSNKCIDPSIHIKHCGVCREKDNPKPLNINNFDDDDDDPNKCRCTATREYKPVCGSDGNNYANFVILECIKNCTNQNINVVYNGLCSDENKDSYITPNRNARSAQVSGSSQGIDALLGCNCLVKTNYAPVCGTDGKTYPNLSQLSCNNWCYRRYVYIDHYGPCHEQTRPAVSKPCRCAVNYSYRPVCGSDRETYPNEQQLDCAISCKNKNLYKIHDGPCNEAAKPEKPSTPPQCGCPISYEYGLLCGSDGEDYPNQSSLRCHNRCNATNVYKVHDGPCQYPTKPGDPPISKRCTCVHTFDHTPLCASDRKTYGNPSQMNCANSCYKQNVFKLYDGPCNNEAISVVARSKRNPQFNNALQSSMNNRVSGCTCFVKTNYEPVCGTDGKTYPNLSRLSCNWCYRRYIYVDHYGACRDKASAAASKICRCVVVNEYSPVCGSDGETYPNYHQLNCANSCNNKNVQKMHDGPCNKVTKPETPSTTTDASTENSEVSQCTITQDYDPICGSDGKDYSNPSFLACHNIYNKKNKVQKVHDGPCNQPTEPTDIEPPVTPLRCRCAYTYEYGLFCGSDGEDYPNNSYLLCHNRCNGTNVYKVHDGRCQYPTRPGDPPLSQRCACVHTYDYTPLCASDGKTYGNLSQMNCANSCYKQYIKKVHNGPCAETGAISVEA